jgi:thioredoxin 1
MSVKEIANNSLDIAPSAGSFAVLDFTATWCPPCKVMNPIFHSLADSGDFAGATFASIDVDANQELAQQHKVMSIPTFLVVKRAADGTLTELKRMIGAQDPLTFRQEIAAALKA